MSVGRPHYDITQVERLAKQGRIVTTKRVSQWLSNHGYDVKETITELLISLGANARFRGSCALVNEEIADEYLVSLPDDEWYLKFWIDQDELIVDVWSCCWDGAAH